MSSKHVSYRRYLLFAVVVAILLMLSKAAAAEGCPNSPVSEEGGTHWCYSAGKQGNVHLWKPAGYHAKTAVTVVYLHGHNIGYDSCKDAGYLDCIWDAHGLPAQFSESGLGALFIAVEGPLNNRQDVKWKSLDALLRSVRRDGGIIPPSTTVAVAHSAGIFTAMRLLDDARLKHLVVLDALYQDAPKRVAAWYRGSKNRRLTLVGASSVHARTTALGRKLKCVSVASPGGTYPQASGCVVAVDADLDHMEVVIGPYNVIPHILARMIGQAPTPTKNLKKRLKNIKKPARK